MIRVRLQVGDGEIHDTYNKYGLMYLNSDNRFSAPTKGFATSTYAEESGEYIDPRTVDDAFDYKVKFCLETPNRNLESVNAKIRALNELMFTQGAKAATGRDGVKTFTTFTFYNDYKRTKIVGTPQPIAEVDEGDLRKYTINGIAHDLAVIELTIRVNNPSLCDFDCQRENEPIYITLTTNGTDIFIQTSRPLAEGERPTLLRRGRVRHSVGQRGEYVYYKSKFKWQVYHSGTPNGGTYMDEDGKFVLENKTTNKDEQIKGTLSFNDVVGWREFVHDRGDGLKTVTIKKTRQSYTFVPLVNGYTNKVCFGIAIYKGNKRVSNVKYFRSNVRCLDNDKWEQWLSV